MSEQLEQSTDQLAEETAARELAMDGASDLVQEVEEPAHRPAGVPDKFWDREAGQVRTEALLKSYLELERKASSSSSGSR